MCTPLGSYLKQVRKDRNLTLRAVEEKTEISNAYLSQLETGKISNPSPVILHKLADCYSVSYEHLMDLAGYPLPTTPMMEKEKPQSPAFRSSAGFDDLTKEEKERVMEFIQFLRSRKSRK